MKRQNHGFNGLPDDTEKAAPSPSSSVESVHPCQSVIQTSSQNHGLHRLQDDTENAAPPPSSSVESVHPCQSVIQTAYKQTEVGVIPEEWEVKSIADIAEVKGGKRLPLGYRLVETPTPHPYIRVIDMRFGGVDPSDLKYVPEDVFPAIRNYRIWDGDIFISVAGTLGIVGTIPAVLSGANLTENADRITAIQCDRDYLLYNLMSERIQNIIESEKTVGAQPKLALNRIQGFRIALPPTIDEQRAIAAALSDVDALIGALDRLIAKKRDLKQAAMQQLLIGRTRLPGFSGEWEVKRLGDFGRCLRGVSYRGDSDLSPYDTEQTIRLLRANNIQNAAVIASDIQFVNATRVSHEQVLARDDIVICMANGSKVLVGKAARFDVADAYRYTFGAFMGCFRVAWALARPSFISLLFQTGRYRDYIANLIAGSSINNLRPGDIESLEFRVPGDDEQTAIAAVLSDMDAEIAALEARRDKTRALKQGMMQELLTGRVRLLEKAA